MYNSAVPKAGLGLVMMMMMVATMVMMIWWIRGGGGSDGKAAGQAPRLDHLLHLNVDDDDYLGVEIGFKDFNKHCKAFNPPLKRWVTRTK